MYLNTWVRPKHVAYIDVTNKICCGWRQYVYQCKDIIYIGINVIYAG